MLIGSGGRIRTYDLRVMSPTSCQTAPPRTSKVGNIRIYAAFARNVITLNALEALAKRGHAQSQQPVRENTQCQHGQRVNAQHHFDVKVRL